MVDWGNIDVFTMVDRHIGVHVSDFRLAGDNSTIENTSCLVGATNKDDPSISDVSPLPVAADGAGQAYLGPLPTDGRYFVTVNCSVRAADGGYLNRGDWGDLNNPIYIDRPQGYDADHPSGMVSVLIDGSPTKPGLLPPLPDSLTAPLPEVEMPLPTPERPLIVDYVGDPVQAQACSDEMRRTFDRYGMSADIADLGAKLAKSKTPGIAQSAFAGCALTADNPEEAFKALCNVGRSMIPADWAYLAIEQLGKNISNDQIEAFGRSTSEAWNAQCR